MKRTAGWELWRGGGVSNNDRSFAQIFGKGGYHGRTRLRLLTERRNGSTSPFLRFFFWLMTAAVLRPCPAAGGAWPREDGELYGKLSVSRFTSDQVYAPKRNEKFPGPLFTDI